MYDFDTVVDRRNTGSLKWDVAENELPMWVADMDFRLPDEILDEFHKRIDHGIFGYTDPLDDYFDAMNHWFSTRYGYTIDSEWVTMPAPVSEPSPPMTTSASMPAATMLSYAALRPSVVVNS